MKIENENLLLQAFKNGINLFVGAGFSILAKDKDGRTLPTGEELLKDLQKQFNKNDSKLTLQQLSSVLASTDKTEFYRYLTARFSVAYVDPLYLHINKLNIKNIYTTNIDNLIPQIVAKGNRYLNDQMFNGRAIDAKAINYVPLHGNVDAIPKKFIFDVNSLANIYNDAPRIWNYLSIEMEAVPTIFLGYSFGDTSVIQASTSRQTFTNAQKNKWILLKETDESITEYYKALGFDIISGDIKDFLEYVSSLDIVKDKKSRKIPIEQLLGAYVVPHSIYEVKRRRPIKEFFTGSSPIWSDILENQIFKTHYLSLVYDRILEKNKRGVIIIGAPVSGKSTLLMQIANEVEGLGVKLYFDNLSEGKAEYVSKLIGDSHVVVFIDDLYESVDALPILDRSNIKIVAAERSHNYSIISHLVDETKFSIINITSLKDSDIQGIYNSLPESIRSEDLRREKELNIYSKDSLFEFVIRNIKGNNIKNRYRDAIRKMEKEDPDLAEFLVLCAYMHSCRIPLSSEMAHAYFSDYEYNYNDIFDIRDDAKDLINDYIPANDQNYPEMDYYYPRSKYIAEIIRDACSKELLKSVMTGVINRVPGFIICNYKTFRKYAFDKVLTSRAFDDWREGKAYYESAFVYDKNNPYVLQQGSLFLASKGKYDEAFSWIDRAISMTDDRYFSIRNTHAIILFNANINKRQAESVRKELDLSMQILERCIHDDMRKRFHAQAYGTQAIQYYEKFRDDIGERYLRQAEMWLNSEVDHSAWDADTRKLRDRIRELLSHSEREPKINA